MQFALPRNVVVDVRCLQDENYARRGIGRHTLALLRSAPSGPNGVRLIGLVDPTLPPLIEEAREVVVESYPNAYALLQALDIEKEPSPFVSLSPMTHDPLFSARFLMDSTRLRIAVVYDFIPRRWPEQYLQSSVARLAYANALRWLARCDLFASISESTRNDLLSIIKVNPNTVAVTGASLDQNFESLFGHLHSPRKHFLVVGGGDPRKNSDLVVRSHAQSKNIQKLKIPLIIGGQHSPIETERFKSIAIESGGDPHLVEVPGKLSEARLLDMYAQAIAVVCPSFDEGFSLPVVEGMAVGAPVLVSDIPAHRELVYDQTLRFSPSDAASLVPLLERAATDPGWGATVVAKQAKVWPRFTAGEVGRRFWDFLGSSFVEQLKSRSAMAAVGPVSPFVARGIRPRIAMLSPLPPSRSGVADYTAATCAELGKLVDLHVFSETEHPRHLACGTPWPFSAFPTIAPSFDRVVHVIGNSHFHHRTFNILMRYGGSAIAHDARMLGFYRILVGLDRTLKVASNELERTVCETELDEWLSDESRLKALFLDEIMDAASPMIVHSRVTKRMIHARRGRSPVHIPFSVYRPWSRDELTLDARADLRTRLGITPKEIMIVTLGLIDVSKAPAECIWAVKLLRQWGFPARLRFVGEPTSPQIGTHLRILAEKLGVIDSVVFAPSYLSELDYRSAIASADVAIQLRTYDHGSISGALLDCVASGTPTVANQSLTQAVGVPEAYVKSIPDSISPILLAEAVADLLSNQRGKEATYQREFARSNFCEERSMASYAASLCRELGLEIKI